MKTIDTLVPDIYEVIQGRGGWDSTITKYLADTISGIAEERFAQEQTPRDYLSLSAVGSPCKRKLWYKVNETDKAEPLGPETLGKFFYGDLLEALLLSLAKAAGHDVQGEQHRLDVHGVKGSRDAVIDGVTVDTKSASSYGFVKFKEHKLREDDPFGYISQLGSYVYAGKDDPLVKDKTKGAFLVVDKTSFKLCLDVYDFSEELESKEQEILAAKAMVSNPVPPDRLPPVPQSKTSPNTKLQTVCGYCEFRKHCWPQARTFLYSNKPEYLIDVIKQPKVVEVKD